MFQLIKLHRSEAVQLYYDYYFERRKKTLNYNSGVTNFLQILFFSSGFHSRVYTIMLKVFFFSYC